MTTMEFDEMKKIWDTQNNEPLYVLNETAMNNRIQSTKNKTGRITNVSELLSIVMNIVAGGTLMATANNNMYLYILGAWMIIIGVIVTITRVRRIQGQKKFDRTILGDLDHAIATATYQVRLSNLLRWNIVPVAIMIAIGLWIGGRSTGFAIALLVFFAIVWYASGMEHSYYKRRKREVEALRRIVLSE